nr:hypothetical protein [Tanacetum cinerariifolium]
QSNTPQLDNEDLEQINTDNLEEMDLKWQTRVECYNCLRRGHIARECHAPRIQGNRSGDNERRIDLVENPASALVVQDGLRGYDWTASDSSVSEIDEYNNQAKDRYKLGIGYHAVPPPYTRNYMPSRDDLSFAGLDDSVFKFKINETRTSVNENESIASKSSEEIRKEPKTVRVDWNGMKTQKQGIDFEFNKRAYFVCGSVNHLIKDCTFYENKMVENFVVNNKGKGKVGTKSGQVMVNDAKQNSTASTSTARPKVNTAAIRPNVNAKSFYFKPHFPKRRHFNQRLAAKTTFSRKINTAKGKNVTTVGPKAVVNAVEGKKENVVKSLACWIWRPKGKLIDHTSKDSGSYTLKKFNYVDPNGRLKHMTGNKSFLTKYQEIDGGFVAFGGSPKGDFNLLDKSQVLLKVP